MMLGANSDIYVVGADGGVAAAADDLARHRHRSELLARRKQDRVRKRPLRIAAALRDECRRHRPAPDQLRRRLLCVARMEPGRAMDRLHPARAGRRGGSASCKPDGTGERMLTAGPGDEGAELGREQPRTRSSSAAAPPAAPASTGSRSTAAKPRQIDHSAGRLGPRLVGSDGLMRRALVLARASLHCGQRASAQLPGLRKYRDSPPRRSTPPVLRASMRCAPISPRSPAARRSISAATARFLGAPAKADACRAGGVAAAASGSRGPDRRPWRSERHARSCAGDRRAARRGSARLSGAAGRAGGAGLDHELGQGAPRARRAPSRFSCAEAQAARR